MPITNVVGVLLPFFFFSGEREKLKKRKASWIIFPIIEKIELIDDFQSAHIF